MSIMLYLDLLLKAPVAQIGESQILKIKMSSFSGLTQCSPLIGVAFHSLGTLHWLVKIEPGAHLHPLSYRGRWLRRTSSKPGVLPPEGMSMTFKCSLLSGVHSCELVQTVWSYDSGAIGDLQAWEGGGPQVGVWWPLHHGAAVWGRHQGAVGPAGHQHTVSCTLLLKSAYWCRDALTFTHQ